MSVPDEIETPPGVINLAWLSQLHADRRLQLVTTVGERGVVHVDGDPHRFVTELIRLASIGAAIGQTGGAA